MWIFYWNSCVRSIVPVFMVNDTSHFPKPRDSFKVIYPWKINRFLRIERYVWCKQARLCMCLLMPGYVCARLVWTVIYKLCPIAVSSQADKVAMHHRKCHPIINCLVASKSFLREEKVRERKTAKVFLFQTNYPRRVCDCFDDESKHDALIYLLFLPWYALHQPLALCNCCLCCITWFRRYFTSYKVNNKPEALMTTRWPR